MISLNSEIKLLLFFAAINMPNSENIASQGNGEAVFFMITAFWMFYPQVEEKELLWTFL
jgi:hypothetical protein